MHILHRQLYLQESRLNTPWMSRMHPDMRYPKLTACFSSLKRAEGPLYWRNPQEHPVIGAEAQEGWRLLKTAGLVIPAQPRSSQGLEPTLWHSPDVHGIPPRFVIVYICWPSISSQSLTVYQTKVAVCTGGHEGSSSGPWYRPSRPSIPGNPIPPWPHSSTVGRSPGRCTTQRACASEAVL